MRRWGSVHLLVAHEAPRPEALGLRQQLLQHDLPCPAARPRDRNGHGLPSAGHDCVRAPPRYGPARSCPG